MVCPRCIMAVTELLTSLGYKPSDVELGYADIDCVDISKENGYWLRVRRY
jgi:hypothetical protein